MTVNPTISIIVFSFLMLVMFSTNSGLMDKNIQGNKIVLIRMNMALLGLTTGILITSIFTLVTYYQAETNAKVGIIIASVLALTVCIVGLLGASFALDASQKCKGDDKILEISSALSVTINGLFILMVIGLIIGAVKFKYI